MPTTPSRSRTLRQRTTGNPLDPNDPTGSLVKPSELVDVVELTPLTLVDRRSYNLLIAHAWDRIDEDVEHAIPKAALRGTHKGNERLSDTIQRLMAGQVEVRIIRDGKRYLQSIHLLATVARPEDESEDGNVYYRFPAEWRAIIRESSIFARLQTEVMFCFSSKYALALWEMVQKRGGLKHKNPRNSRRTSCARCWACRAASCGNSRTSARRCSFPPWTRSTRCRRSWSRSMPSAMAVR